MSCYNSTIIEKPIETVWNAISDFHNLEWAKGVIETCDVVGDKKGNEVGSKRLLNNAFHETLVDLRPESYYFKYSIDDGPGPIAKDAVKNYFGEVQLHRVTDTDQTFFVWTSKYDSPDEAAVKEFCDPIYQALLSAAKNNI